MLLGYAGAYLSYEKSLPDVRGQREGLKAKINVSRTEARGEPL